jgi:tRNA pseudouridine55 synthase
MHGFLNIDKPVGPTSHDVVARVRRLAGRGVKVGHAGTLDPGARGVLPVALGDATRLIEHLADARKGYRGLARLGRSTSSDDAAGETVAEHEVPPLTPALVEAAVVPLRGDIMQVPPAVSALHVDGRRAYDLVRQGEQVALAARPAQIYRLDWAIVDARTIALEVECGKGTYIRALARDIGAALGCGGHLDALERSFVGPFQLAEAVSLDALSAEPGLLEARLLPPALALADWPAVTLDEEGTRRIGHGLPLRLPDLPGEQARAHGADGALLALLRRDGDLWRPTKVFVRNR